MKKAWQIAKETERRKEVRLFFCVVAVRRVGVEKREGVRSSEE
jgi:hypothetical protein